MKRHVHFLILMAFFCMGQGFGPKIVKGPTPSNVSESLSQNRLMIWHKPETLSGSNGDPLSRWIDSSSNHYDATNVNASATWPTLLVNGIDSKNVLHVWGASTDNGFIWTNNAHVILQNVPGATFYAVACMTNTAAGQSGAIFDVYGNTTGNSRYTFFQLISGNNIGIDAMNIDGSTRTTALLGMKIVQDQWYLFSGVIWYTNGNYYYGTNGVTMKSGTLAGWTSQNTPNTASALLRFGFGNYGVWHGNIAEFLLYNIPHDTATRRGIETNYFKPRYPSITIN